MFSVKSLSFVVVCCYALIFSVGRAQTAAPQSTSEPGRKSFTLTMGLTSPQGRNGIREFWLNGPSVSLMFNAPTNQNFTLGVGTDLSLLYFDQGSFIARWPGVPILNKDNLFIGNIYLNTSYFFLPRNILSPFLSVQCGAEFISEAVYKQIVGGIRQTYYEVGGKTRIALGVAAGVDYYLSPSVGLRAELKSTIIHNDPDVSTLAHLRIGVQYKF